MLRNEHEINILKLPFEWLLILKRVNIEPEVLQSGARAVKSPGRGFDLTRFLHPFHQLEKDEPSGLRTKAY